MGNAEDAINKIRKYRDESIEINIKESVELCGNYFLERIKDRFSALNAESKFYEGKNGFVYDIRRCKRMLGLRGGELELRIESKDSGKFSVQCYDDDIRGLIEIGITRIEDSTKPQIDPDKTSRMETKPRIKFINQSFYRSSERPKD